MDISRVMSALKESVFTSHFPQADLAVGSLHWAYPALSSPLSPGSWCSSCLAFCWAILGIWHCPFLSSILKWDSELKWSYSLWPDDILIGDGFSL